MSGVHAKVDSNSFLHVTKIARRFYMQEHRLIFAFYSYVHRHSMILRRRKECCRPLDFDTLDQVSNDFKVSYMGSNGPSAEAEVAFDWNMIQIILSAKHLILT